MTTPPHKSQIKVVRSGYRHISGVLARLEPHPSQPIPFWEVYKLLYCNKERGKLYDSARSQFVVAVLVSLQLLMLSAAIFMSEGEQRRCSDELCPCYEFVSELKSQSGAAFDCRDRGGTLAEIPNNRRQHRLKRLFRPSEGNFWIGGRLHFGGEWRWVNGTSYPQS